jgi:hypothetical protein
VLFGKSGVEGARRHGATRLPSPVRTSAGVSPGGGASTPVGGRTAAVSPSADGGALHRSLPQPHNYPMGYDNYMVVVWVRPSLGDRERKGPCACGCRRARPAGCRIRPEPEIHRVGPEFASWSSSLTGKSLLES